MRGTVKQRQYWGYPLARLVVGVIRIQRRHAARVERIHWEMDERGIALALESERLDTYWYLRVMGFNSIDEFTSFVAQRTTPQFASRLLDGHLSAKWERRLIA
jgi:hypothetical protein